MCAWFWVRMLCHTGISLMIHSCIAPAGVALAYPHIVALLVLLQDGAAQPVPLLSFMYVLPVLLQDGPAQALSDSARPGLPFPRRCDGDNHAVAVREDPGHKIVWKCVWGRYWYEWGRSCSQVAVR